MCRKVGVETGDRVHIEMRRLGDTRPHELEELLKSDPKGQKAWNVLSVAERRDFVLFVADAKKTGDTHASCETASRSLTVFWLMSTVPSTASAEGASASRATPNKTVSV
jgi:hypothetical protein